MKKTVTSMLLVVLFGVLYSGADSSLNAQGSREGINVHGQWSIDIRKPDGALIAHRDFENDLTDTGRSALVDTLARKVSLQMWRITLHGVSDSSADQLCLFFDGNFSLRTVCVIEEDNPDNGPPNGMAFRNLQVSAPRSGKNANQLVLSGYAIAHFQSVVGMVETQLFTTEGADSFTQADVRGLDLEVEADQIIQVTAVISFASAPHVAPQ